MHNLKNFLLVSNTSKLYSENKKSYIFLKVHNNIQNTVKFQVEEINENKDMIKNKSEVEIMNERNKNELILYKPLMNLEIYNVLTRIHCNFLYRSVKPCAGCNIFSMKNREENQSTALVPWSYNSRALIPYKNQPSNDKNSAIKLKDIINFSLQYTPENSQTPNQERTMAKVEDNVDRNPSKFALSLSEIWEEMKELEDFPSRNDVSIEVSRNCRSCPAVVSIKSFTTKFSHRRTESKVLLLSCDNFAKFEETFTRLLAKNKVRNVKPLLQNLENKDQILTKLERAFINHNLRINRNNNIIKRNVIMMKSKMMDNIKERLHSREDTEKKDARGRENTSVWNIKNSSSKISNNPMTKTKKSSNIMIVNDEIFKGTAAETHTKSSCEISGERNTILYLNNVIFKELKKEKVKQILNRKYTSSKIEKEEVLVRIPTRQACKKLSRPASRSGEQQQIPLENLITAAADKRRIEDAERSRISYKVFKEFEETMKKVKILNFPSPEDVLQQNIKQNAENEIEHSKESKMNSLHPRKRRRSAQGKEESKFVKESRCESPNKKENSRPKIKLNRKSVKENTTYSSNTMSAMDNHLQKFKINPHRINLNEHVAREKIHFVGEEKKESLKTIKDKEFETKSNKDKAKSRNTLRIKGPDKVCRTIPKINESKQGIVHSEMKESKETKLKNDNKRDVRVSKQRQEIKVVKINTSALSNTIAQENTNFKYEKNTRIGKNEHKESSLSSKSHARSITTAKNKKGRELNLSTIKNETDNTKTTSENLSKMNIPKKKEFKELKENRNSLLDSENRWYLEEEEEENSVIVLHQKPMKSLISSSHFEIAENLVENPEKKVKKLVKSQKDALTKKIYNKHSANRIENKLRVVEEMLGSTHSSEIQKVKRASGKKIKSKLPILGTPTSIKKHIEKVVAKTLANSEMGNNFSEDKIEEDRNKLDVDRIGKSSMDSLKLEIRKINENKRLEIDEILAMNSQKVIDKESHKSKEKKWKDENTKDKKMDDSEENFNKKNTSEMREEVSILRTEEKVVERMGSSWNIQKITPGKHSFENFIDSEKQLKGTEPIVDSETKNQNEVKDASKENGESVIIVYETESGYMKVDASVDNINRKSSTTPILDKNEIDIITGKNETKPLLSETSNEKNQINAPENNSNKIETVNVCCEEQFIIYKGTQSKGEMEYKVEDEIQNLTEDKEVSKRNIEETEAIRNTVQTEIEDSTQNTGNENSTISNENKSIFASGKSTKNKPELSEFTSGKTQKSSTETNSDVDQEIEYIKKTKNKNSVDNFIKTYLGENEIENYVIERDSTHKKTNLIGEKNNELGKPNREGIEENKALEKSVDDTISIADSETIRKKRLIYFEDRKNSKHQVENEQCGKIFSSKSKTTEPGNKSKKEVNTCQLHPEKVIENSSQTSGIEKEFENSTIQTDQTTESKSPAKKESNEKHSSFSQYDNQMNIERSEKAIETETDHKDAAVIAKHESAPNETKKTANHKILKQSVSDNVIIIKAARTDSEETVESVEGITKSFLKQLQSKMNIVQNSKFKNHTMQKCREIAVKLKKSQEKFVRNIPSNFYKICQEARKIKNKLSRTKTMTKRSREIINKFTNTFSRNTIDNAIQAELKETKISSYKPENKVKSVIERKVTSKMKLLSQTQMKTYKKKKTTCKLEPTSREGGEIIQDPSLSSSMGELQNRSIGSLFADTVASALARCGDVDRILSKYSDSKEKILSKPSGDIERPPSIEKPGNLMEDHTGDVIKKDDEFLMSDGIRKLVVNATVERNEDNTSDDQWTICPKVILVSKSNSGGKNEISRNPGGSHIFPKGTSSYAKVDAGSEDQPNVFSSIPKEAGKSSLFSQNFLEEQQQSNSLNPNHDDEANALEETKQDLTKLKILLQEEKDRTVEDTDCEEITLIKNNETLNIKIRKEENDTPKSIVDLETLLISDRNARTAEGSTPQPPDFMAGNSPPQEVLSNGGIPANFDNNDRDGSHEVQKDISEVKLGKDGSISFESSSTLELKSIDGIPAFLTLTEADSKEVNSPEIFMTPLTSNTDFAENSDHISSLKVSELLPEFTKEESPMACKETNKDESESPKSSVTSRKTHTTEGQGHLTRKEEIELSCKLNNYPNSLVCRERKTIVKTAVETCESLERKVENVLNESKGEGFNEMFKDLERMGNCILKTVSSKDKVSSEEPTGSKIRTLTSYTRNFATNNLNGAYSRFREWKPGEDKVEKKEKYDLDELKEIHDEALGDEMFFGEEMKRRKKEITKDIKDKPRKSIYHDIVRQSEIIEAESGKPGEIGDLPVEHEENLSREHKRTLLDIDGELKDDNKSEAEASSLSAIPQCQEEPDLSNSERQLEKEVNDTIEEIVLEVHTEQNTEPFERELNSRPSKEENEEVVFETIVAKTKQVENKIDSRGKVPKDEDIKLNEEQILTQMKKLGRDKEHKILEKFALISQEQDSSIFKINKNVKFDLSKKRMCEPEHMIPQLKKNISKIPNQEGEEKPLMIVKLSQSSELKKPQITMSDSELKNLLLRNPKILMKIASDIMSKNQYLSFLLDLKSTKELREYWMNKIKEGIVSSKSLRDLTKVMDYFKVRGVTEHAENAQKSQSNEELMENKSGAPLGSEHESKSANKESPGIMSTESDVELGENTTTLEMETKKSRAKSRQHSPSTPRKKMLDRNTIQNKSSKRNLSSQQQKPVEIEPFPYTLENYLKSPLQNDELRENDENSILLRINKNLHGKEIEMEITHEDTNVGKELKLEKGEAVLERKISPVKKRVGQYLVKLKEGVASSTPHNETCSQPNLKKIKDRRIKTEQNIDRIPPKKDRHEGKVCNGIVKSNITRAAGNQINSGGKYKENKANPQQTAIVLPGREPIKISLITNEMSASPVASIRKNSEKNVLENLSDVLSNCSSPVSSSNSGKTDPKKKVLKKSGLKRNYKSEILQSNTPIPNKSSINTHSLQKSPQKAVLTPKSSVLNLKKFENPLKEFVRNHDDCQPSNMTNRLSNIDDIKTPPSSLLEEIEIPVVMTKSLSEVLKEDPDFLRKIREKKLLNTSKENEAAKKFEYRFHDFRRKEDKCMEMQAKRQEEQKKDLFTKFKCLIQARKVATERNRQNIRSNETQQIQPKVFSKILEKISYFKEFEGQPSSGIDGQTVVPEKVETPNKRWVDVRSPRVANGNRRLMHTKRKQINEDELVTWVQEHPAVPVKRVAMENVENREEGKQNVIHIPWTPTFHRVGAQSQ